MRQRPAAATVSCAQVLPLGSKSWRMRNDSRCLGTEICGDASGRGMRERRLHRRAFAARAADRVSARGLGAQSARSAASRRTDCSRDGREAATPMLTVTVRWGLPSWTMSIDAIVRRMFSAIVRAPGRSVSAGRWRILRRHGARHRRAGGGCWLRASRRWPPEPRHLPVTVAVVEALEEVGIDIEQRQSARRSESLDAIRASNARNARRFGRPGQVVGSRDPPELGSRPCPASQFTLEQDRH